MSPRNLIRRNPEWKIGAQVRVGFLRLTIVSGPHSVVRDSLRLSWRLQDARGRRYTFTPHEGIQREG